jgi:hypothetical protein
MLAEEDRGHRRGSSARRSSRRLEAKVVQPNQITATTRHPEPSEQGHGIATTTDNAAAAKHADHHRPGEAQVAAEASPIKKVGQNQIGSRLPRASRRRSSSGPCGGSRDPDDAHHGVPGPRA